MFKVEIFDLQGQVIVGVLGWFGYFGILDVCQGKRFELEVDDMVDDIMFVEIVELLLVNIVIEDWMISWDLQ